MTNWGGQNIGWRCCDVVGRGNIVTGAILT